MSGQQWVVEYIALNNHDNEDPLEKSKPAFLGDSSWKATVLLWLSADRHTLYLTDVVRPDGHSPYLITR